MTMTTPSLNTTLRFSGQAEANRVRTYFKDLKHKRADVVTVSVNEKPPVTPVKSSLQKLREGWIALAGTVTLGALAVLGVVRHPSPATIEQHKMVQPYWQKVEQVATKAKALNRLEDRVYQNEYDFTVQSFLFRVINTMPKYPNKAIDQGTLDEIKKEVATNPDFNPDMASTKISGSFVNFLDKDLKLSEQPSDIQIEKAGQSFKTDFLDLRPEYKTLKDSEKNDLIEALKQVMKTERKPGGYMTVDFQETFKGYLGTATTGVKLKDFANSVGEKGAVEVFTAIASNPAKFKKLDEKPGAREAFIQHGTQLVQSVEYPSLAGVWALILLGSAGAGAVGLMKRQQLTGLVTGASHRELKQNLDKSTLLISMASGTNLRGSARQKAFSDEIKDVSEKMVKVQAAVYTNPQYAEVKGFLDELFPGGLAAMPTAEDYREHFQNKVYDEILNTRTRQERLTEPVARGEDVLAQVSYTIGAAYNTGEFLPEDILLKQKDLPQVKAGASDKEKLMHELRRVDSLLESAMLSYAFRIFGKVQGEMNLADQQAQVAELELKAQHKMTVSQNQVTEEIAGLDRELKEADEALTFAKSHKEENDLMAGEFLEVVTTYLPSLRDYRRRLQEAVQNFDSTKTLESLQQTKDAAGKTQADPMLEKILNEQAVERAIAEEKTKQDAAMTAVKKRLAEAAARREQEKQAKPVTQTAQ